MKLFNNIFIILLLSVAAVSAQASLDSLKAFKLDSIVVTATRSSTLLNESPFSVEVIEPLSISNNANPLSLQNIIGNQTGVLLNGRFNPSQGDRIQIRGIGTRAQFGVKGIRIILDGIPLTFPDGQSQLNNIDIQNLESIEILKGPSSVLYGNSLGGIIIINSKQTGSKNFSARPEVMLGSYGLKKYGLYTSKSFNNFNISLSGYQLNYEGYREHSQSKYYGINLAAGLKFSDIIQLSIIGNYYNAPYLLNPGSLNKFDSETTPQKARSSMFNFGTGKKAEQLQSGINVRINLSDQSKINTMFYTVSRTLFNSIPGRLIELDRIVAGARLEFHNKLSMGKYSFTTLSGLDYEVQYDQRIEFENQGIDNPDKLDPSDVFNKIVYTEKLLNQNENVESIGFFTNISFKPFYALTISAGLRYDRYNFSVDDKLFIDENNNDMNNLSSMVGFSSSIINGITIFGNYSNGFQTPTTNELSNNPYDRSGFNEELNPEQINNYEIGIKYWAEKLNLLISSSAYRMNISNMLIPYQSETEETFYRNAGKANNTGLEIQLKFYPSNFSNITANYAYMNFKFSDYIVESELNNRIEEFQIKGNSLPGVPKNKLAISFNFSMTDNFYGNVTISWIDKFYTNDFNGPTPGEEADIKEFINDSYTKVNLNAVYKITIGGIKIITKVGIENLLDEQYNDSIVPNAFGNNFFEPASARSLFFSISSEF